jgi:hypothetical protein
MQDRYHWLSVASSAREASPLVAEMQVMNYLRELYIRNTRYSNMVNDKRFKLVPLSFGYSL